MPNRVSWVAAFWMLSLVGGCSQPSPSGSSAQSQTEKRRDRYRFYDADGREQFDFSVLVADLKGDDGELRIAAAKVIPISARSGFGEALAPLIKMLSNADAKEHQASALAISNLVCGGNQSPLLDDAVDPLLKIASGKAGEDVRKYALMALGDIAPISSVEQQAIILKTLVVVVDDSSYHLARYAMDAIGEMGARAEDAIPILLQQLRVGEHRSLIAAHALGNIHCRPDLCVPALIAAMQKTPQWTEDYLRALRAFGPHSTAALPGIRKALTSGNGNILIASSTALTEIGPAASAAVDDVLTAFRKRETKSGVIQDDAQIALLFALISLAPPDHPQLQNILNTTTELHLRHREHLPVDAALILERFAGSQSLRKLGLAGCTLSFQELGPVASFDNLVELSLPASVTNQSFQVVAGLSKLQVLKQDFQWRSGRSRGPLDDRALEWLRNCTELREIELRIQLSSNGLAQLAGCQQLRSVTLWAASDFALGKLPALPLLETLFINDGDVTDAGIPALLRIRSLRHLSLRSTDVTDAGIATLVKNHPKLISLNLAHVNVTKKSVPQLLKLIHLKELTVYTTPLAGQRDVLDMGMTSAVVQLKQGLPHCQIIYAD